MMNETTTSTTSSRGNWVAHIDDTKRGLAKLLARENLTVRHDQTVSTAAFNLKTRELILPTWSNITVDQYDLLIGHEVAHAKYSDEVDALTAPDMTPGLHSYINVLEDTRIERLIQAEFPGLRGSFRRGYADFFANGPIFNDIKTTEDAAKHTFIDRVNIHYKIGASVTVPFSAAERAILPRIDNLRSMADAIALARELYTAEKERQQAPQSGQSNQTGQSEQSRQTTSSSSSQQDGDSQSSDTPAPSETNASQQAGDGTDSTDSSNADGSTDSTASTTSVDTEQDTSQAGDPVAMTDVLNANAVRELATTSSRVAVPTQLTLDTLPDALMAMQTISSADYLSRYDAHFAKCPEVKPVAATYLSSFTSKYGRTIAQLAQAFERRKTAKQHERAKQARTGRIDVNKLHAYKFRDDLFKTVTMLPNGQNHGIVLLVDGSGSMNPLMTDVLQQTMLLASFAKRVRVPVQAYMFGTAHDYSQSPRVEQLWASDTLYPASAVQLVTLLDSTAARWNDQMLALAAFAAKFDDAMRTYMHQHRVEYGFEALPYSKLGDTPLYSGLMLVERHLARLKAQHRLEKTTLFVLSDGGNNASVASVSATVPGYQRYASHYRQYHAMILRDRVTRKMYVDPTLTDHSVPHGLQPGTGLIHALVDSIRQRHDARVVMLRIVTKHQAPTGRRWHTSYGDLMRPNLDARNLSDPLSSITSTWKEQSQYVLPTSDTYFDAAIIVASTALDLDDEADFATVDTTGKSTRQVLSSFKKAAVAAASNRVLVNTIIPYIA